MLCLDMGVRHVCNSNNLKYDSEHMLLSGSLAKVNKPNKYRPGHLNLDFRITYAFIKKSTIFIQCLWNSLKN